MTVNEYYLPQSLDQALKLLDEHQDSLLVSAGGTVTMPLINEGISVPEKVMGLRHAGLDYIHQNDATVAIGSMTRISSLLDLESIPLLQEAAQNTGAWAVRNLATVGGNLFVPPPSGDVAVALLALDSEVRLVSSGDDRWVKLSDFYKGFMSTAMRDDELLVEIKVPTAQGKTVYKKFGRKQANTPAIVTVAVKLHFKESIVSEAQIALGAVGPHPIRAYSAEAALKGKPLSPENITQAASAASEDSQPFTDAIATEWYRRKMTAVFVERALNQLAGKEE